MQRKYQKPSDCSGYWQGEDPLDDGFVIFYEPDDYYLRFFVVGVLSVACDSGEVLFCHNMRSDPAPPDDAEWIMYGDLKWDGCMNVEFGHDVMPHFCGLRDALSVERALRQLYALGAEHVDGWDAACAQ